MVKIITTNAPERQPKRIGQTAAQKAAKAELIAVRDADKARRLDTRRKVVIGAALMALAERDEGAADMLASLKRNLTRDTDRKLFEK